MKILTPHLSATTSSSDLPWSSACSLALWKAFWIHLFPASPTTGSGNWKTPCYFFYFKITSEEIRSSPGAPDSKQYASEGAVIWQGLIGDEHYYEIRIKRMVRKICDWKLEICSINHNSLGSIFVFYRTYYSKESSTKRRSSCYVSLYFRLFFIYRSSIKDCTLRLRNLTV